MKNRTFRLLVAPGLLLLAACAGAPTDSLTFQEMQAKQAAVQSVLNDGTPGAKHLWSIPGGASGFAQLIGATDGESCRQVKTSDADGTQIDLWCPTPHGFWVHPDEAFYRNATGRETYGGTVRSRRSQSGLESETPDTDPTRTDCLRLLRERNRLSDGGREAAAREMQRAYRHCLHQSN